MNTTSKTLKSPKMRMEALCRATNLSRSTVYQYLRSGILHPPKKEGPTQSRYDETHLRQIKKIRYLREQKKMSIPDIQKMFDVEKPNRTAESDTSDGLKKLIIDKALELFSKSGFAKTKITDITNELNLGKGTFYLYFKSKEELFLESIERVPEILLPKQSWEEIRKEQNYFQRTSKRLLLMLDAFPTFMGVISIAKLALRGDDQKLAKKAMECFQTINRALTKDIERAIRTGVIREVDQEYIAFISFGIAEAVGYWLLMNPNYSSEECTRKLIDVLSHGLAPKDANAAGKANDNIFSGKVVDLTGTAIQLQGIRFNEETHLKGKLGGGSLQIDIEKIGGLEVKERAPKSIAFVTMKAGEIITIQIDSSVILSGKSSFGKYTIPITEISSVAMKPICENEKPASPTEPL